MTFVDYYRGDYDVIFPASLTEEYQFYFVFFRENLVGSNGGLNVIKLLVCLFVEYLAYGCTCTYMYNSIIICEERRKPKYTLSMYVVCLFVCFFTCYCLFFRPSTVEWQESAE